MASGGRIDAPEPSRPAGHASHGPKAVDACSRESAAAKADPVLEVEGLTIAIAGRIPVVEDFGLTIGRGEIVALVGESGSGKSITALALLGLLPAPIVTTGGRIAICGTELLGAPPQVLDGIRGNKVGMIFQQPKSMLDPTCKAAAQVGEPLRIHRRLNRKAAWSRAVELLREVGIPDPARRANDYPHQLSGGMAQRVMIASALSGDPEFLIADEPTTALDVTVQAQILYLLARERERRDLSILLISHDLSVVAAIADRIVVMYAGRIVEEGRVTEVMNSPKHPYTTALVQCALMEEHDHGRLYSIPGTVQQMESVNLGCRFLPRCNDPHVNSADSQCARREPPLVPCGQTHTGRCWAIGRSEDAGVAVDAGAGTKAGEPPRGQP